MFVRRTWLRVCIVLGFVLMPAWVMLEEGVRMGVVSAVTTLLVVICAVAAVYTSGSTQSDDDSQADELSEY